MKLVFALLFAAACCFGIQPNEVAYHEGDAAGLCSDSGSISQTALLFSTQFCPAFAKAVEQQSHKRHPSRLPRKFVAEPPDERGYMVIRSQKGAAGPWNAILFQLAKPHMSARGMRRAGQEAAENLLPAPSRNKPWFLFLCLFRR